MLSLLSRFLFFIPILLIYFPVIAQLLPEKNYPRGYFQWPVDTKPGIVANFGELRNNHFHMGLDCRTDKKENLPVLASASGYIAKVKIEPYGFGRSITINHQNGLSTLYAHLNDFFPELEKYIKDEQYKLKHWNVTIMLPENVFQVKKGDFIAYSGNTGGSQGPHLHFEIRDTKTDKVLNPLLFEFPIKDNIPPSMIRLAVYDRQFSTYEQSPKIYTLKKVNAVYTPVSGNIIVRTDKVSFAITSFDQYTGSTNQNGIYKAELFLDEKAIAGFEMDSISYDETRYLNAHIDYKTRSNGGPYLQHLSKLPGFTDGIYKTAKGNDGVINLDDEKSHDIKIIVRDADNNSSTLSFSLKILALSDFKTNVNSNKMFYPDFINIFENDRVNFYLPERSLYDSFRFIYNETVSANGSRIYQLHNSSVPLQNYFTIKIREDLAITDTGKIVMKRFSGKKDDYKKAFYDNGWYSASFREFGNFQLMVDNIPPAIIPIGFKDGLNASRSSRIVFKITDNTEEIMKFTALLDGNWIRFSNDKGKNFIYYFDEHCSPGYHELQINVEDQVGNITEKTYHFTR